MPAKRSRTVRSSSFGDTTLLNQLLSPPATRCDVLAAPAISSADVPPSAALESYQSRPRILTLASPEIEESTKGQVGNFLEKCFYCKKRIGEDDEVFMYSYLRAFCSSECRAEQISMDKMEENVSGKSTEGKAQRGRVNNVKLFGVQL